MHHILTSFIGACMKGQAAEKETPLFHRMIFVPSVIKLGSQQFYNSFSGF